MPYKKKYGMRKRRPTYRPRKYIKKAVYQAKKRVLLNVLGQLLQNWRKRK